jgi:hypothetical protein
MRAIGIDVEVNSFSESQRDPQAATGLLPASRIVNRLPCRASWWPIASRPVHRR